MGTLVVKMLRETCIVGGFSQYVVYPEPVPLVVPVSTLYSLYVLCRITTAMLSSLMYSSRTTLTLNAPSHCADRYCTSMPANCTYATRSEPQEYVAHWRYLRQTSLRHA